MNRGVEHTRLSRVFLCHSSHDKGIVRDLYRQLSESGCKPWLDEQDLLPGQDWQNEISKAVCNSDIVLVCLSKHSVSKKGFVQKEIQFALNTADQQPEGAIYIIPVRLEECAVPQRLTRWQWVDLFEKDGFEQLIKAIQYQANVLAKPESQIPVHQEEPEWRTERLSLLIVDDNRDVLLFLQHTLSRAGWNPLIASSASQAREIFKLHYPRAVLLDYVLGEEDGLTLALELQAKSPHTRFVLMTGTSICGLEQEYICKERDIGILRKPFLSEDVASAFARAFQDLEKKARE